MPNPVILQIFRTVKILIVAVHVQMTTPTALVALMEFALQANATASNVAESD